MPAFVEVPDQGVLKFGATILAIDLFLTFSRTLEFFPIKAGPLSLAVAVRLLLVFCAVLSGGVPLLISSRVGKCLLFLTFWMIAGIPFSVWKGGSIDNFLHFWLPSVLAYVGAVVVIRSFSAIRKASAAMAFASVAIVIFSRIYGGQDATNDRFNVGEGSLGNSNDLATMLILCLPFMLLYLKENKGRRLPFRLLIFATLPLLIQIVTKTGSRAGLISLIAYALIAIIYSSGVRRVAIICAILAGVSVFLATAPASSLARYRTILPFLPEASGVAADKEEESAQASSEARNSLMRRAIEVTMDHPIFGSGLSTFEIAAAEISKSHNEHQSWHGTHNAFLQVAADLGVPAFLAYVAAVGFVWSSLWWVRRNSRGDPDLASIHQMAGAFMVVMTGFFIAAFFTSLAYVPIFPFLAGVFDAFQHLAKKRILLKASATPPPVFGARVPLMAHPAR